jgi:hypothetical protein
MEQAKGLSPYLRAKPNASRNTIAQLYKNGKRSLNPFKQGMALSCPSRTEELRSRTL